MEHTTTRILQIRAANLVATLNEFYVLYTTIHKKDLLGFEEETKGAGKKGA